MILNTKKLMLKAILPIECLQLNQGNHNEIKWNYVICVKQCKQQREKNAKNVSVATPQNLNFCQTGTWKPQNFPFLFCFG